MTTILTGERVNLFALAAVARAARFRADHGQNIMRGLTLARIEHGYGVKARTFAQAADGLYAKLAEAEQAAGITR